MEKAKTGSGTVKTLEVFDKDGKLKHVEVRDSHGDFVFDILWDETEEHTPKGLEDFRGWVTQVIQRYGYNL